MRLSELTGVSLDAVKDQTEQIRKRKLRSARRDETREQLRPVQQQQRTRGVRYDNPRSAAAEEGVVRLLYEDPALFREVKPPRPEDFSSAELRHLYELLLQSVERNAPISLAALGEQLTAQELSLFTGLIQQSDDSTRRDRALADYMKIIQDEALQRSQQDLREIARRLKEGKAYGDKV